MSMRRVGLLVACWMLVPSAFASPGSSRVPYGSFPIAGSSLARLRKDMRADAGSMHSFAVSCRNLKSRRKLAMCDADGDKIVNMREKLLGTKPRSADTDNDRLSDRAEIMRYHTNPLVADTDGDGTSDGDEALDNQTDPTVPDPAADCGGLNFDGEGNTTSFGIPASIIGNIARGQQAYAESCGACHAGVDKGAQLRFAPLKTRIAQAPMMITSLGDARLADIVAYLHRAETGAVCTPTPSPTPTPGSGCGNQYFDAAGNTALFGIPANLVGNIGRGTTLNTNRCVSCHTERGQGMTFSQLKAAVTGPKMNITNITDAQYADLIAYSYRALASTSCGTPTPSPSTSPSQSPTATPTPGGGGCANQYFDANGNTTQFGIPSPYIGNLGQGSSFYSLGCMGCHGERGTNFTFSQLKTAVTGPLMHITTVSDQQYANLVAFLNRSHAPTSCTSPTPTPTPVTGVAAGQIVFQTTCQSCHLPSSGRVRRKSANAINEAIQEVNQMNGIVLSPSQMQVLVLYLATL